MINYFDYYPGTPMYNPENPDYRCSIKCSDFRFEKAEHESRKAPTPMEDIIKSVNEFLEQEGLQIVSNPIKKLGESSSINYDEICEENNLSSRKDIVWMKFSKDGHIGVVARADDVNFAYTNTSGKILAHLKKEWNNSFVMIFPIPEIPEQLNMDLIKRGIGNFLIEKNIPILDFYSHNY